MGECDDDDDDDEDDNDKELFLSKLLISLLIELRQMKASVESIEDKQIKHVKTRIRGQQEKKTILILATFLIPIKI